jgi:predicted nuclease with TOPRIM domain
MNFEERMDALAMNLELTARDIADFRQATEAFQRNTEAFQRNTEAFQEATNRRIAQWETEKKHLDEKVDSLLDSTRMLLTVCQAHENRIERLERTA